VLRAHSLLGAGFLLCLGVYLLAHGVKIEVKPPNQNLDINFLSQKTSRRNRQPWERVTT